MNVWVDQAAVRISQRLHRAAGGRLPLSVRRWRQLCEALGVPAGPVQRCQRSFTARLLRDERLHDGWIIAYNPARSDLTIRRYLCHELAEFIAIGDYPCLFDGLPTRAFCYTGGSDPNDARHKVAQRVEALIFGGRP